jgi:F420 biosynthesis protein FbiB-like protein
MRMADDLKSRFGAFLRGRRSIRRFRPEDVPRDLVRELLDAACQAPSAHNRQPWRFVALERGEARRDLVDALSRRFRRDLEADGIPADEVDRRLTRSQERLGGAPWLIVLCLSAREMDVYPDPVRRQAEREMALQSCALAGGHLLLAAHASGLGACWMCAPLFAPEVVRQTLTLPDDWEPQAAIALGYPAEPGAARGRKPVDEVTLWR